MQQQGYEVQPGMAMQPGMAYQGFQPSLGGANMGFDVGIGLERVFPAVRLRGLPFDVTEDEIRIFLGCEPVDILLVKRDGRFSGEAFVVLGSTLQIQMAVDKNKSYMGRRYVEVFRAKKLDYYKAVMAEMMDGTPMHMRGGMGRGPMGMGGHMGGPRSNGFPAGGQGGAGGGESAAPTEPTNVLRLRGLPFSVQKGEIAAWFADLQITPVPEENVHIITDYGRPTGIALVEFSSPQDAQAGQAKDKQMMGTRYIEIFMSSKDELQRYLPRSY